MSAATIRPSFHTNPRLLGAIAFGAAGLAVTGGGVYAALNATASNTSPESVKSGVLSLTMANNGVGFSQGVSNLAPGDTVNRFVDLTQGAALDAKDLTLSVVDGSSSALTTDSTRGLHLTVTQCSVEWTPAAVPACAGSTSALVTNVPLNGLASNPVSLQQPAIAAGAKLYLQISLTLPDQSETTSNGNLPASTIQGLSSSLTWTFSETQRTASTIGS